MQIYELRINDKKNEAKIFWCSSTEEIERVTKKQIKQGARTICWEKHNIPTAMLAMALPALRARDKKQTLSPPTTTFKNNISQPQSTEMKSEVQK